MMEPRSPDDLEARTRTALRQALIAAAPPIPADLKAALLRLARERAPKPSWIEVLRGYRKAGAWALGAGAAFAAAGALLVLRGSTPPAPVPVAVVSSVAAAPSPLADLWNDDDGGDDDER